MGTLRFAHPVFVDSIFVGCAEERSASFATDAFRYAQHILRAQ